MATHKFRVGQKVELIPTLLERYMNPGDNEVVRQLPDGHGEFYYRVKSSQEPHERVVKESLLRSIKIL